MITEPIAMNLFFVNLEGARLIQIDDETVVPEVHVELEREDVGCTTCGVVAVVKDRRLVPSRARSSPASGSRVTWSPTGRVGGSPSRSARTLAASTRSPRSSDATGTRSTTR